jgi:hypothetical protein
LFAKKCFVSNLKGLNIQHCNAWAVFAYAAECCSVEMQGKASFKLNREYELHIPSR